MTVSASAPQQPVTVVTEIPDEARVVARFTDGSGDLDLTHLTADLVRCALTSDTATSPGDRAASGGEADDAGDPKVELGWVELRDATDEDLTVFCVDNHSARAHRLSGPEAIELVSDGLEIVVADWAQAIVGRVGSGDTAALASPAGDSPLAQP